MVCLAENDGVNFSFLISRLCSWIFPLPPCFTPGSLLRYLRGSGFLLSARCPAFSFTCLGFIASQGSLRADRFGGVTSRGLDLGMVMGYSSAGNTRRFIHFLILYLPALPCDDTKGQNERDVFDFCVLIYFGLYMHPCTLVGRETCFLTA